MRTVAGIFEELVALIKKETMDEVKAKLEDAGPTRRPKTAGYVLARKELRAVAQAPAARPRLDKKKPGAKRDQGEIDRLVIGTLKFIQENPNCQSPAIAEKLGVPRIDLALPLKKLRAAGKIVVKGDRKQASYKAKG